jgi:hypothetical protein
MRLLVVLIGLVFTVGCACGSEVPVVPVVQPVIEQPTYQGVTQYDYKAGAPNEHAPNLRDTSHDYIAPVGVSEPSQTYNFSGGGSSWGGSWNYSPTPVKVIIMSGTVTITVN